jgi:hypothetical protein
MGMIRAPRFHEVLAHRKQQWHPAAAKTIQIYQFHEIITGLTGDEMFDLIGDIHGHADELVHLLDVLGYRKERGIYRYPERKVIFLGDFIDRGRQIRQVLEIVRPMVEADLALAVMGNHEWNALAFHTEAPDRPGEFLRAHTARHVKQLSKTLEQVPSGELSSYLDWFRTLPMWLDLDGLRVVHACWDEPSMTTIARAIRQAGGINTTLLQSAFDAKGDLFAAVEAVLKGKEAKLPERLTFQDKDGTARSHVRTRWYLSPTGHTYHSYAFETAGIECHRELEASVIDQAIPYPNLAKPLFIGHYWLAGSTPEILADNVACLDFSVAKGGFLCAYRWQGEKKLDNANFVRADK